MMKKTILGLAAALILGVGAFAAPRGANTPPMYNGQPLDFWIKALHDKDVRQQHQAVYAVKAFGPAAKAAVPDLLAVLKETEGKADRQFLRQTIGEALGSIGPDARAGLPALTAMLNEPFAGQEIGAAVLAVGGATEAQERAAVRLLLLASGRCRVVVLVRQKDYLEKNGARLMPHFVALLKDPQAPVRSLAASGLASLGAKAKSAAGGLLDALKDKEPAVVAQAALALVSVDEGRLETAAAALLPLLNSEPGRSQAVYAAVTIGPRMAPHVLPSLASRERGIRDAAQHVLASLGEPVVPLLIEALGNEQPLLRAGAASTLGRISNGSRKAIPALVKALKDTEAVVGYRAAVALVVIDSAAALPAIPVLLDAFRTDAYEGSLEAAAALRMMGPKAKSAGPALRDFMAALNERIPTVRCPKTSIIPRLYAAALALEAVDRAGGKPAIPVLIAMLEDPQYSGKVEAAAVLAHFGAEATDAVPALKQALKGDMYLMCMAAQALAKIAPDQTRPAVVAVMDLLKKQQASHNANALLIRTLAILGPLARDAVPVLESMLEAKNEDREYASAEALVKVDPSKTSWVIERLKAALRDENEDSYEPLQALCHIAPASPREVSRAILEVVQGVKMVRPQKFRIVQGLVECGPEGKAVVVEVLTELSKDRDKAVAARASQRLKQYLSQVAEQTAQP
jgi:HEAT repeat protein